MFAKEGVGLSGRGWITVLAFIGGTWLGWSPWWGLATLVGVWVLIFAGRHVFHTATAKWRHEGKNEALTSLSDEELRRELNLRQQGGN